MRTQSAVDNDVPRGSPRSSLSFRIAPPLLFSILSLATVPAFAIPTYSTGPLSFSTTGQSMWGTGSSFQAQNSVFVGAQWTNKSGGIGGHRRLRDGHDGLYQPRMVGVEGL